MSAYTLNVVSNIAATESAPEGAAQMLEVFEVECAEGLAWVKAHADELASKATSREYVALLVTEREAS